MFSIENHAFPGFLPSFSLGSATFRGATRHLAARGDHAAGLQAHEAGTHRLAAQVDPGTAL